MSISNQGFKIALAEAQACLVEDITPVGACIVGTDGKILGRGRNMRIQNGSPILHVSICQCLAWICET